MRSFHYRQGPQLRKKRGFSLVEILAVIGIIVILAGISMPAFMSMTRSNQVTIGADKVVGLMSLARQTAMTQNRKVEVRFYCLNDKGAHRDYQGIGLFLIDEEGEARSMGRMEELPETVVIDGNNEYSSIIGEGKGSIQSKQDASDRFYNASTICFHFLPNGSVDLNMNKKWFLTIRRSNQSGISGNWITISVDPVSGLFRVFRPN